MTTNCSLPGLVPVRAGAVHRGAAGEVPGPGGNVGGTASPAQDPGPPGGGGDTPCFASSLLPIVDCEGLVRDEKYRHVAVGRSAVLHHRALGEPDEAAGAVAAGV